MEDLLKNEFVFYSQLARPLVLNLPKPKDRILAASWIKKLADENSGDEPLRTIYLKLLLFTLQRRRLTGIFGEDPTDYDFLEALPLDIDLNDFARNMIEVEAEERQLLKRQEIVGDVPISPPITTDCAADLTEYAAAQDIPNFGVHAYYAISKHPIPKWQRADLAVFPKGTRSSEVATEADSSVKKPCPCTPKKPEGEGEGEGEDEEAAATTAERENCIRNPPQDEPDKKKRRKKLGASPPSHPIGRVRKEEDERVTPTWGTNLVQVRERPKIGSVEEPSEEAKALHEQVSLLLDEVEDENDDNDDDEDVGTKVKRMKQVLDEFRHGKMSKSQFEARKKKRQEERGQAAEGQRSPRQVQQQQPEAVEELDDMNLDDIEESLYEQGFLQDKPIVSQLEDQMELAEEQMRLRRETEHLNSVSPAISRRIPVTTPNRSMSPRRAKRPEKLYAQDGDELLRHRQSPMQPPIMPEGEDERRRRPPVVDSGNKDPFIEGAFRIAQNIPNEPMEAFELHEAELKEQREFEEIERQFREEAGEQSPQVRPPSPGYEQARIQAQQTMRRAQEQRNWLGGQGGPPQTLDAVSPVRAYQSPPRLTQQEEAVMQQRFARQPAAEPLPPMSFASPLDRSYQEEPVDEGSLVSESALQSPAHDLAVPLREGTPQARAMLENAIYSLKKQRRQNRSPEIASRLLDESAPSEIFEDLPEALHEQFRPVSYTPDSSGQLNESLGLLPQLSEAPARSSPIQQFDQNADIFRRPAHERNLLSPSMMPPRNLPSPFMTPQNFLPEESFYTPAGRPPSPSTPARPIQRIGRGRAEIRDKPADGRPPVRKLFQSKYAIQPRRLDFESEVEQEPAQESIEALEAIEAQIQEEDEQIPSPRTGRPLPRLEGSPGEAQRVRERAQMQMQMINQRSPAKSPSPTKERQEFDPQAPWSPGPGKSAVQSQLMEIPKEFQHRIGYETPPRSFFELPYESPIPQSPERPNIADITPPFETVFSDDSPNYPYPVEQVGDETPPMDLCPSSPCVRPGDLYIPPNQQQSPEEYPTREELQRHEVRQDWSHMRMSHRTPFGQGPGAASRVRESVRGVTQMPQVLEIESDQAYRDQLLNQADNEAFEKHYQKPPSTYPGSRDPKHLLMPTKKYQSPRAGRGQAEQPPPSTTSPRSQPPCSPRGEQQPVCAIEIPPCGPENCTQQQPPRAAKTKSRIAKPLRETRSTQLRREKLEQQRAAEKQAQEKTERAAAARKAKTTRKPLSPRSKLQQDLSQHQIEYPGYREGVVVQGRYRPMPRHSGSRVHQFTDHPIETEEDKMLARKHFFDNLPLTEDEELEEYERLEQELGARAPQPCYDRADSPQYPAQGITYSPPRPRSRFGPPPNVRGSPPYDLDSPTPQRMRERVQRRGVSTHDPAFRSDIIPRQGRKVATCPMMSRIREEAPLIPSLDVPTPPRQRGRQPQGQSTRLKKAARSLPPRLEDMIEKARRKFNLPPMPSPEQIAYGIMDDSIPEDLPAPGICPGDRSRVQTPPRSRGQTPAPQMNPLSMFIPPYYTSFYEPPADVPIHPDLVEVAQYDSPCRPCQGTDEYGDLEQEAPVEDLYYTPPRYPETDEMDAQREEWLRRMYGNTPPSCGGALGTYTPPGSPPLGVLSMDEIDREDEALLVTPPATPILEREATMKEMLLRTRMAPGKRVLETVQPLKRVLAGFNTTLHRDAIHEADELDQSGTVRSPTLDEFERLERRQEWLHGPPTPPRLREHQRQATTPPPVPQMAELRARLDRDIQESERKKDKKRIKELRKYYDEQEKLEEAERVEYEFGRPPSPCLPSPQTPPRPFRIEEPWTPDITPEGAQFFDDDIMDEIQGYQSPGPLPPAPIRPLPGDPIPDFYGEGEMIDEELAPQYYSPPKELPADHVCHFDSPPMPEAFRRPPSPPEVRGPVQMIGEEDEPSIYATPPCSPYRSPGAGNAFQFDSPPTPEAFRRPPSPPMVEGPVQMIGEEGEPSMYATPPCSPCGSPSQRQAILEAERRVLEDRQTPRRSPAARGSPLRSPTLDEFERYERQIAEEEERQQSPLRKRPNESQDQFQRRVEKYFDEQERLEEEERVAYEFSRLPSPYAGTPPGPGPHTGAIRRRQQVQPPPAEPQRQKKPKRKSRLPKPSSRRIPRGSPDESFRAGVMSHRIPEDFRRGMRPDVQIRDQIGRDEYMVDIDRWSQPPPLQSVTEERSPISCQGSPSRGRHAHGTSHTHHHGRMHQDQPGRQTSATCHPCTSPRNGFEAEDLMLDNQYLSPFSDDMMDNENFYQTDNMLDEQYLSLSSDYILEDQTNDLLVSDHQMYSPDRDEGQYPPGFQGGPEDSNLGGHRRRGFHVDDMMLDDQYLSPGEEEMLDDQDIDLASPGMIGDQSEARYVSPDKYQWAPGFEGSSGIQGQYVQERRGDRSRTRCSGGCRE